MIGNSLISVLPYYGQIKVAYKSIFHKYIPIIYELKRFICAGSFLSSSILRFSISLMELSNDMLKYSDHIGLTRKELSSFLK